MDQGTIGIAVITIGVNLFGWFFLSTGRFQSEYQSNNKKVEAVLFEEFHQHLEELRLKEKELEIQGKEKDSLYKDDKVLMKKFDELTDWKMHIQNGKKDLRVFSFFALVAMVLFGISIMIYPSSGASNREIGLSLAPVLAEFGILSLIASGFGLWHYCVLCREIDAKVGEL